MKPRYKYVPSIDGVSPKLKGLVVSKSRARWKETHDDPRERTIRLLRFIWMRKGTLTFEDRHCLHSQVLGALFARGLVEWVWDGKRSSDVLVVSATGERDYLKER